MDSAAERRSLVSTLFPDGTPTLWCPTLTHFLADGRLDKNRIRRHLEVLAPYAKGILVPGSTGEGWDMDDSEVRQLLETVLDIAGQNGIKVLIGVLRHDLDDMLRVLRDTMQWLAAKTGRPAGMAAMQAANVAGFTVCPPRGSELTQEQIHTGLSAVLELGYPIALYQLPQVTENEMTPETVADLARRFPNFYLFKDTSGEDRVASANVDLKGVFLVRGAEGQYHQWPRAAGGPYDGFLLSTANCFSSHLATILERLANNQAQEGIDLSERISRVVTQCFEVVRSFPAANPFTNANKALDHVMAYGTQWNDCPAPYLRGQHQLPMEFIQSAFELLKEEALLPERGYLG
jgi:dihydrodipicolinate synthase/N-acetylneuraminate lyase